LSQLRYDRTTGDWVLVAPGREGRPAAGSTGPRVCPFCPGNEHLTPPELDRVAAGDGWSVRVFPNLYPLLSPQAPVPHAPAGFAAAAGLGTHEVVVESPEHGWNPADAEPGQMRRVLGMYARRHRLLREAGPAVVVILRNQGRASGATLEHPHTQVMSAPVVPGGLHHQYQLARRHRAEHGEDLYGAVVRDELADGTRIVATTAHFVAFVPFAATTAGELWICPRIHRPGLADAGDAELDDLARLLPRLLAATRTALGDPAYNLVVLNGPETPAAEVAGDGGAVADAGFPWHLRLLPRVSIPGGYELGTGARVTTQLPERGAQALREAMAAQPVAERAAN
jgi:UDPglucose--hexose-1-phosphate uridylyltransferase